MTADADQNPASQYLFVSQSAAVKLLAVTDQVSGLNSSRIQLKKSYFNNTQTMTVLGKDLKHCWI